MVLKLGCNFRDQGEQFKGFEVVHGGGVTGGFVDYKLWSVLIDIYRRRLVALRVKN
jgi:hypothetical protein